MASEIRTIDQYISSFPGDVQERLLQIRSLIRKLYPQAGEHLFYKVPSMTLSVDQKPKDGLMFAAFKNHIGLYPKPETINKLMVEIEHRGLEYSEGTIKFNHKVDLPLDFIELIILAKISESS
jgi:uncharacterized protein YdhG (YjbR/CyaY superfamily)